MTLKSWGKAETSAPAPEDNPAAGEALHLADLDLDAYSLADLAKLQQRIDAHMNTPINKLNLLNQTARLYHIAQAQLEKAIKPNSNIPTNHITSTINGLQAILVNLTKHEGLLYSADRLLAFERSVILALSAPGVPATAKVAFYEAYEAYLGETLDKPHD